MQSIKIINNKLKIIYNHAKCVRYQGIRPFIDITLVMLYLKYFVKYDLTAVFYHAITYSLFNYLQTKTSAKCINK